MGYGPFHEKQRGNAQSQNPVNGSDTIMAPTYWKIWASIWFRASCTDGMGLLRLMFYLFFFMAVHVPSSSWRGADRVFWMPLPLFDVFILPVS
jgi:hypothetical protein